MESTAPTARDVTEPQRPWSWGDAAAAGALATLAFVLLGLGDHLLYGVIPAGAHTPDVAGGLALAALTALPLTIALAALLARLGRGAAARVPATTWWRLALFAFVLAATEGLWSMLVYYEYPGYSLNTRHLIAYAAGILPLAAVAWWVSGRAARAPWPPVARIGLCLGWAIFFDAVAGWLPALYPAGTSPHLAHGGAALAVHLSCVALGVVTVREARAAARLRRVAVLSMLALLPLAAVFALRFPTEYAVRDAAARGGRLSRTTLRYTQYLLSRQGLGALARRAPPAAAADLGISAADSAGDEDAGTWSRLLATKPTGIVIFTTDATRADAARSREAVVFTNHHSTAPGTRESLTALFTGHYVWEQPRPSFFDRLRESGWHTIAVGYATGANQYIQNGGGEKGFVEIAPRPLDTEHAMAPQLTDALLEKLDAVGDRKFAAWVHHLDPHAPYDPPGSSDWERYLGEVSRTEAEIDRAVAGLRERGLLDRTAIVISADHGEHFGEHGMFFHNMTAYEEVLRVPLAIIPPGADVRARITRATSGIDVKEALLALLGEGGAEQSAPPTLFDDRGDQRIYAFTSVQPHPWRPVGVVTVARGRWKLFYELRTRAAELYDLAEDPRELRNLVDERPDVAAALASDLQAELARTGVAVD